MPVLQITPITAIYIKCGDFVQLFAQHFKAQCFKNIFSHHLYV